MKSIYKIFYTFVRNVHFGSYGSRMRVYFLRKIIGSCGNNVFVGPNVTIVHPENLFLGNNISIHQDCYFDCSANVNIGDDVSIAHGVSMISFNHTYIGPNKIRNNQVEIKPIHISENVWIGCKATILAGVSIDRRTIVAAGAVVNKSLPGNHIIGGVPAKLLKDITACENK